MEYVRSGYTASLAAAASMTVLTDAPEPGQELLIEGFTFTGSGGIAAANGLIFFNGKLDITINARPQEVMTFYVRGDALQFATPIMIREAFTITLTNIGTSAISICGVTVYGKQIVTNTRVDDRVPEYYKA